ncbi:MAG: hypothetical protein ABW092_04170 [Candidatus Thiodiazotropha sp.]
MYHKIAIVYVHVCLISLLLGCGGGGGGSGSDTDIQPPVIYNAYTDLEWIIPKTRTDGSYLLTSSIAGYKVYYGIDDNNLDLLVDLQISLVDEYRIGVPDPGSFFFAIAAYDSQGNEGSLSNIVFKDAYPVD